MQTIEPKNSVFIILEILVVMPYRIYNPLIFNILGFTAHKIPYKRYHDSYTKSVKTNQNCSTNNNA